MDLHPSIVRNRGPILSVLRQRLPDEGLVLEIASGSGGHAAYFTEHLPGLRWQPTDLNPDAVALCARRRREAARPNFLPPIVLDATAPGWPVPAADAMVNINMIHISPWEAAEGLLTGAGRTLVVGGVLCIYGPFRVDGQHTAPSNARFDAMLRSQDPRWGIRDVQALEAVGAAHGLVLQAAVNMPANNFTLVFARS